MKWIHGPAAGLFVLLASSVGMRAEEERPNVVIILMDDMGYADPGCYGATAYKTPEMDKLAAEGMRFTDFYVSSPVCSASRAAFMTGCYNERVGIRNALGPGGVGLNPKEDTIAEVLKKAGYVTGMAGKWHLGDKPARMPRAQGFDEFYGLPYSNDMWPHHPEGMKFPPLPLYENEKVVNADVTAEDQKTLTRDYTRRATDFIRRNKERPFFFYLAHSAVHVPLYTSDEFRGKSGAGTFGDVMAEVDNSVGKVMATLKECGIDRKTLVILSSDNGPWLSYGDHAGSAKPLREGKGTVYEGGIRVPMIARWPEKIPAGTTCGEMASAIDLLPTIAEIAKTSLPEKKIDGLPITKLLTGIKGATTPHDSLFFYYADGQLQGMRDGNWKLIFPHTSRTMGDNPPGKDGMPGKYRALPAKLELYDLKTDIGESRDVAKKNPEIIARLQGKADGVREQLGDSLRATKGTEVRAKQD